MNATDAAIIGAGPFGLSISAFLTEHGIDHLITGEVMETWSGHMPAGMLLKSEPYASAIAAPKAGYDLASYCAGHGLGYVDRVSDLPLPKFLGYANWYAGELVPKVLPMMVTDVSPTGAGFQISFADAAPVTAGQVIVSTGVLPYAYLPSTLTGMPAELVSHVRDHNRLDQFSGRRVAVVGCGQSALETAALLNEQGAEVRVIARTAAVNWNGANPAHLSRIGHLRRPVTQLCEGWHCAFWYRPSAFRLLPRDIRLTKCRTVLGPGGSSWLRNRVDGVVDILTSHQIRSAEPRGNGVRLTLDGPREQVLDVDHVIAGTGYRIDLSRLPFLPDQLRSRIRVCEGYPVVSRTGESSVPGLYFTGAPTAFSIGPSARFIAGTHTLSAKLAGAVAQRCRG